MGELYCLQWQIDGLQCNDLDKSFLSAHKLLLSLARSFFVGCVVSFDWSSYLVIFPPWEISVYISKLKTQLITHQSTTWRRVSWLITFAPSLGDRRESSCNRLCCSNPSFRLLTQLKREKNYVIEVRASTCEGHCDQRPTLCKAFWTDPFQQPVGNKDQQDKFWLRLALPVTRRWLHKYISCW